MARRSTAVEPEGTQTMTRGLAKLRRLCTLRMKCLIISSAISKSAMDAVPQGSDGFDVAGRAAEHQFGLVTDR